MNRACSWSLPLALVALAVTLAGTTPSRAETRQLTITTIDEDGREIPARVLVRDAAGKSWLPPVALAVRIGPDTWFAGQGQARLDVPEGTYRITAERGPEYQIAEQTVVMDSNRTGRLTLHRWIDLRPLGYRSGENHLHVPGEFLNAMTRSEGLDYGTSLSWWNGPHLAPPTNGTADASRATFLDAEVENDWGALYAIGLRSPMPLAWNARRSNFAFAQAAKERGALVCYQGGWSREALVDALLEQVDVINLGDNLFHRHKFMPRSRNSNLLNVAGLPTYPDTAEGMLKLATESYYRLLNCGLRLAAGAGSATGVKSNPAGYNRTYVKVDERATVRDFLEQWRHGRNFVSNGPMLFLTADGNREPGDTLELPPNGKEVTVRAVARSDQPLRSLAIVMNGRTVATSSHGELETTIRLDRGSWIAAVCTAEDRGISDENLARYEEKSPLGGELPTRLLFAHTSPIYVTSGGKGAREPAAVAEAHRMLDAFAIFARRAASPEFTQEILDAINLARVRLDAN